MCVICYTKDFRCVCVCVRGVLFMVMCGTCLCSAVQFVRRVVVDLVGAILSLFVVNQLCSVLRYGWRSCAVLFASLWVHVSVMSSA